MFEVGFGEILMLGVVALLVIGPEQLPKVARTAGLWFGRARRMIATVKADIEREIKADELRELLSKQALSNPLEEIMEDIVTESKGMLNNANLGTNVDLDNSRLNTNNSSNANPDSDFSLNSNNHPK